MTFNTAMTFSELILKEEELLNRILLVSIRQKEIVEEGNFTVLVAFLLQRQRLWEEFERLESQLAPHKGIAPENRVWENAEERQRTEESVSRIKELLENIMANDQISFTKTAAQHAGMKEDLWRVQKSTTVVPAYAKHSRMQ